MRKIILCVLYATFLSIVLNPFGVGADQKTITFIKPNPEAQPYWTKGLAAFKSGDYEQAVLELSKYIEMVPTSTMAHLLRGHTYYKQSNYDYAIADFQSVLDIQNGNEYFAYANLATVYLEKKDYEQAWQSLHKAEETLAITGEPNEAGTLNFILIKTRGEIIQKLKVESGREQ